MTVIQPNTWFRDLFQHLERETQLSPHAQAFLRNFGDAIVSGTLEPTQGDALAARTSQDATTGDVYRHPSSLVELTLNDRQCSIVDTTTLGSVRVTEENGYSFAPPDFFVELSAHLTQVQM